MKQRIVLSSLPTKTKHPIKSTYQRSIQCLSLLVLVLFGATIAKAQTTSVTLTTGSSWAVPCGVTSVTVECWGGGGGGGGAQTAAGAAAGGGTGGSYVKAVVSVTSGGTATYSIGAAGAAGAAAGGNGGAGGSTWFGSNTTLLAVGGAGGTGSSTTGNITGGAAATTGNIGGTMASFYGGAGGTSIGGTGATATSGAGGGSAGTGGNGGNATNGTAGAAGSGTGGNPGIIGAVGITGNTAGTAGGAPGAGGSGGRRTSTTKAGGAGGLGQIIITYTVPVAAITGGPGVCVGATTAFADATGGGTWTLTNGTGTASVNTSGVVTGLTAGTATLKYGVTFGGCTNTVTLPITISVLTGVTATATVTPTSICGGTNATLKDNIIGAGTGTMGSITSTTNMGAAGTGAAISPFSQYYSGQHTQYLVMASDLTAAGMASGNLTSLAFYVRTKNSSAAFGGYTISLGATSATTLASGFISPTLTTVYGPTNYTTVAGANTFPFTTPFNWDGTSNILVDVCFFDGVSTYTDNDVVRGTTKTYTANYGLYQDESSLCGIISGGINPASSSVVLPVMTWGGNVAYTPTSISWSDGTTTVGTTNPATVAPTNTGTSNVGITYTATAIVSGCALTSSVNATVLPLPAAPTPHGSAQCGFGVPTATVTSNSGLPSPTYVWYTVANGGTAIPGETANHLTSYGVGASTTLYVSEFNGTCESPRAAVPVSVSTADAITAKANGTATTYAAPCANVAIPFTNTQTGSTNTYTSYKWTASPQANSGLPVGGTTGATGSLAITPTAGGTYTYTLVATDGVCSASSSVSVTVSDPFAGTVATATATPASICTGASTTLNVSSNFSASFQEGFEGATFPPAGWAFSTPTGGSPWLALNYGVSRTGNGALEFDDDFSGTNANAWGITPGIYMYAGSTYTLSYWYITDGFNEKMKTTIGTAQTVAAQTTALGTNVSSATTTWTNKTATYTPATSGVYYIGFVCTTNNNGDFLNVDDISVTGGPTPTYSWSDGVTTVGATNPLTVSPTNATSSDITIPYTASIGYSGCTLSKTVNVTVKPLPTTPTATNSSQCGYGVPTASVTSTSGAATPAFSWYTVATNGTAIPGETGNHLTTYAVSTTTTFYVAETNGTCESARIPVNVTVTQPDAVTASANGVSGSTSACINAVINFTQVQTGSTNTYTSYTWTATPQAGSGLPVGGVTGTTASATPTVAGVYTYQLVATDGSCSAGSAITVTVNNPFAGVTSTGTANPSPDCSNAPTTLNITTNLDTNFVEGFESGTFPPTGWTLINAGAGHQWIAGPFFGFDTHAGNGTMEYDYTANNAANAWAMTPGIQLIGGVTYNMSAWYEADGFSPESFKVTIGTSPTVASQTTTLYDNSSVTTDIFTQATGTFTPSTSGTYYMGINCYSAADEDYLAIDDITLTSNLTPTYSWSDGTTIVGTANPQVVTPQNGSTTDIVIAYTPTLTVLGCSVPFPPVNVTVKPLPVAPTAVNGTQCGYGVPTVSVTSNSGIPSPTYSWYTVASGGSPLPGETLNHLTAYNIASTTTFYVAEVNSPCESGRAVVTATVTQPNAITATVNGAATPLGPCLTSTLALNNTQAGSTNTYTTYTWSATPAAGSGLATPSTTATSALSVTPTAVGTYIYQLVASDGTCSYMDTVSVTIKTPPMLQTPTATPTTVCSGTNTTLSATVLGVGPGAATVGTQTTTDITGGPYREGACTGNKAQYLFTASELTAAGFSAGNFGSLAFNVTSIGGGGAMNNYTINMASTTATSLTGTFDISPATTVYGPVAYTAVSGVNTHTFSTPFVWDGTSNVVVTVCHDELCTGSSTVAMQAVTNEVLYNITGATTSCPTTTGTAGTVRPVITFSEPTINLSASTSFVWMPGNLSGSTVTATPINAGTTPTTQIYTVTANDPSSACSSNATVSVTVNPLPSAPTANNSIQCGSGIPAASVTSTTGASSPVYAWYLVANGGTAIAGETADHLTSYTITTTTDFYVTETNGTCESPRTHVLATSNTADPVTAKANGTVASTSACISAAMALTTVYTPNFNNYTTFTWTATPQVGSGIPIGGTTGQNISVTPTAGGTYTYTIVASDGSCSATSSVTVTVNDPFNGITPTVTANPTAVCSGSNTTLTFAPNPALNYTEGFEGATFPPTGWVLLNPGTGNQWIAGPVDGSVHGGSKAMEYDYNSASAANTWAMSKGMTMVAGFTYNISFWYNSSGATFPEKLNVTIGNAQTVAAQTTTLYTNSSVTNTAFAQATATFTPATSGTYYLGFNCFSDADEFYLDVDDISVTGGPQPTFSWSDGTTTLGTTNPITVVPVNTGTSAATVTYTATVTAQGCSVPASATVTVNPIPVTPTAVAAAQCGPQTAHFQVTPAGTYRWYTAATGGTLLGTSTTQQYDSLITANTTLYAAGYNGSCESPRTAVTVTVTTPPSITVAPPSPAAICPGAGINSTLGVSSSNSGYTYVWTPGNLTGASQSVSPASTTTYTVTATDNSGGASNGCISSGTATVSVSPVVPALNITPGAPAAVCGTTVAAVQLNGATISVTSQIGSSTTLNAANAYPAPLSAIIGGTRQQMLIRASELTAAGLSAGDIISSLGFNVSAVGSTFSGSLAGFSVAMGNTANTTMGTAFLTVGTIVHAASTLTVPTTGLPQTLTVPFTTNYTWDGTSNIVVQTSWSNDVAGTATDYVQMAQSDPGYLSTSYFARNTRTVAQILASAYGAANGTSGNVNARPNMTLGYTHALPITWTPATDLYTNAGATTAYTAGAAASTVYARPHNNTIYTATATSGACTGTAAVTVGSGTTPTNAIAASTSTATSTMIGTNQADFHNSNCELMASLQPSGAAPVTGDVTSTVTISSNAGSVNNDAYVRRLYYIEPVNNAANATATVTLYATQADFDDCNTASLALDPNHAMFPSSPTGSTGKVRVMQYHDNGTPGAGNSPGGSVVVTPTSITWDATNSRWALTFPVTGFSNFYIYASNTASPLPVVLKDITATNEGTMNKVEWHSGVENGLDHYDVMRSRDGVTFEKIDEVKAEGMPYGYITYDKTPYCNVNYYRLNMVALNGEVVTSETVHATVTCNNGFVLHAHPNPVSDVLTVDVENATGNAQILLTDVTGKVINTATVANGQATFRMNGLAAGIYYVRYSDDTRSQTIKVNKQ